MALCHKTNLITGCAALSSNNCSQALAITCSECFPEFLFLFFSQSDVGYWCVLDRCPAAEPKLFSARGHQQTAGFPPLGCFGRWQKNPGFIYHSKYCSPKTWQVNCSLQVVLSFDCVIACLSIPCVSMMPCNGLLTCLGWTPKRWIISIRGKSQPTQWIRTVTWCCLTAALIADLG